MCHSYGPDDLKIYTQGLNAVGAALTVDLQLLRNGSMNAQQVATLRNAWDDRWLCAADHGNSTCCCGQANKPQPHGCGGENIGVALGDQCKADRPTCVGFIFGSQYGHCI